MTSSTTLRPGRHPRRSYEALRKAAMENPGCSFCTRGTWRMDTAYTADGGPACTYNAQWVDDWLRYFQGPPMPYREFHHNVHMAFDLPCDMDCSDAPVRDSDIKNSRDLIRSVFRIEVIAERLTELTGYGPRLRGKCPFHDSRGRSFSVDVDTQTFKCFNGACVGGGDVVRLIDAAKERGLDWESLLEVSSAK